jgi:hypothetical protein
MGLYKTISVGASTLTVDGTSVGATYDIPLGDPALYLNDEVAFFILEGNSTTLATSLSVTSTYTPIAPLVYKFMFDGGVVLGANNFSFFGTQLTAAQALYPAVIEVWWDGAAWNTVVNRVEIRTTGVANSDLAPMPPQTVKMNSGLGAGVPQDVDFLGFRDAVGLGKVVYHIPVSFNSGEQSYNTIMAPVIGEVTRIGYIVTEEIAGTDDATIDVGITNFWPVPVSNYIITIPAGTIVNTGGILNTKGQGLDLPALTVNSNYIGLDSAKPTWGGKALLSIEITLG